MLKNQTMSVAEYRNTVGIGGRGAGKNRKIKNATKVEAHGIKFDSKLEKNAWETFTSMGLNFEFKKKIVLVSGFIYGGKKIIDITWTPDFIFEDIRLVVDTKGFPSETYPIKLKLFKKKVYDIGQFDWLVWEIHKSRDIMSAATLIKKRIDSQEDVDAEKYFSV